MNFELLQFQQRLDALAKKMYPPVEESRKFAVYFIGLDDNHSLLHMSYVKPANEILEDCVKLYDYAKLYKPISISFTMTDCELTDVDKYVKVYMQMFGKDTVRGGSYIDIVLPEWQELALEKEFKTASFADLDEKAGR